MDWTVGIPSYRRSDVVSVKTLRVLAEGGVPRERVFLAVTNDEIADYRRRVDPGLYASLISDVVPGSVASAHNRIVEALGPGDVVQMDDDIRALKQQTTPTTHATIADVGAVFDLGFTAARSHGATLWGVYPVCNAFYMRRRLSTGLSFCIGHCFGQILSGRGCERTTLDVKNDYERTLRHFMADGGVVRLDWIAAESVVYTGRGGMQGVRTAAAADAAIGDLQRRFPGLVRRKRRVEGHEWPEIALVQPR